MPVCKVAVVGRLALVARGCENRSAAEIRATWRVNPHFSILLFSDRLRAFDFDARTMHGLFMATKTISLEVDAYDLLKSEKRGGRDSFSQVVRRLTSERPALTAGELEEVMKPFIGKGAGKKRAAA